VKEKTKGMPEVAQFSLPGGAEKQVTPKKDWLQKTGDVVNAIFPGKQVGEAIGTLGGYIASPNKEFYDTSAPSPLQVAGDVAQGALMVGTGMPETAGVSNVGKAAGIGEKVFGKALPAMKVAKTALGRIGQTGLVGAGFGATQALKEGQTGVKEIGKQAAIGGLVGGALGTAGEIISAAASHLPERITRQFIPGINEETNKYAVQKGLGAPKTMLNESDTSIKTLGSQLGEALKAKGKVYVQPTGEEILNQVVNQFPDSGMGAEEIAANLKKLAPLKSKLIDKVVAGEASLTELHNLNSAIGDATFKSVFDDPTVKAGKQIGSAFYHTVSDLLKTELPESAPLFDNLTKEYQLNQALRQVVRRGAKAKSITLRDIVAFTSGLGALGPIGGAGAVLAEKGLVNPTINLQTAGLMSKLAKPVVGKAAQAIRAPLIGAVTKGVSGLLPK
jgi:hypothetical protein